MPEHQYVAALLADLDGDREDFREALAGREIASVFFGGGTPSLFAPDSIAAILDGASARIPFAHDCEITLETNPGTVEHGRFEGYLNAGVNRISFGIQSFDDAKLRALGRIHSSGEAEAAVKLAQDAGFANINLDLMYALPDQTLEGALADMERAVTLEPAHISHYQLTLEPGTPFAKRPPPLPGHDAAWDMQEACQARLAETGYAQYEVSAYARPGRRCRHNLNYWRFGDYLGIGAGAHGKISGFQVDSPLPPGEGARPLTPSSTGFTDEACHGVSGRAGEGSASQNLQTRTRCVPSPLPLSRRERGSKVHRRWKTRSPLAFMQGAGTRQRIGGDEILAVEQLPFEFMLNALRLNEGVATDDFVARTGLPATVIERTFRELRASGWLVDDDNRLRTTGLGSRFLNDVIEAFLPESPKVHVHA